MNGTQRKRERKQRVASSLAKRNLLISAVINFYVIHVRCNREYVSRWRGDFTLAERANEK